MEEGYQQLHIPGDHTVVVGLKPRAQNQSPGPTSPPLASKLAPAPVTPSPDTVVESNSVPPAQTNKVWVDTDGDGIADITDANTAAEPKHIQEQAQAKAKAQMRAFVAGHTHSEAGSRVQVDPTAPLPAPDMTSSDEAGRSDNAGRSRVADTAQPKVVADESLSSRVAAESLAHPRLNQSEAYEIPTFLVVFCICCAIRRPRRWLRRYAVHVCCRSAATFPDTYVARFHTSFDPHSSLKSLLSTHV